MSITVLGYRIVCEATGCDEHADVAVAERTHATKILKLDGWHIGSRHYCPTHAYIGEEALASRGEWVPIKTLGDNAALVRTGVRPDDFPPDAPPPKRASRRRASK